MVESENKNIVTPDKWGRDHLSTFAYIGYVIVHLKGRPQKDKMRVDADLHPGMPGPQQVLSGVALRRKYPTRLKGHSDQTPCLLENHDDWSCVEDFEAAGLVKWEGTGINPVFVFTPKGWKMHHAMEHHIASGKPSMKFDPTPFVGD